MFKSQILVLLCFDYNWLLKIRGVKFFCGKIAIISFLFSKIKLCNYICKLLKIRHYG